MREPATTWNPLRLLTRVTSIATTLAEFSAIIVLIVHLSALGWLPGTDGNDPVCVDRTAGRVCIEHPTTAQQIAGAGNQIPQVLFALGALLLLHRFLRTASQEGPYAGSVPGKLAALGWFVLVGAPVSALLYAVSRSYLGSGVDWFHGWGAVFPWWALATGVAALTFAHILRIGVRMREDLEGTI